VKHTAVIVVAVVATVAAALLDLQVPGEHRRLLDLEAGWLAGVPGVALAVPGALLLKRIPTHPVAWILAVTGLHWSLDGLASSWLAYATLTDPALPGAEFAFWAYQRLGASLLLALPLVLLFYPDGRLPAPRRWRTAALASLATTSLFPLMLLVVPSDIAQEQTGEALPAPLATLNLDLTTVPLPAGFWQPAFAISLALVPLSLLVPFAVVVRRYRAATGAARTRMRWLLWAAAVDVLVMLSTLVLTDAFTSPGLTAAVCLTGIAIAIGIVRPDAANIDELLGGTLRYGTLAIAVVAVDALVLSVTSAVAERDAAVLALLLVAAVYGPLRSRLWRLARRVLFGRRDDRYGVVASLAEQLERSPAPEDQLLAVARTVAEAFRAPFVAVEVDRDGSASLVASYGTRPPQTQVLPITYRGEAVGRLVLGRPGRLRALSARDERLLGDVVRQAAAAARATHLAAELQHSRHQIVTAREEERRRLRRDLHDGLGPSLGAVALRIDAARNVLGKDPARGDEMLVRAREDARAALADVRRLVHDLRPPALDDVGLLGAVRQQAARVSTGLTVRVDGGAGLDRLPAAVEVAAYRIVSEALANVVKHASASACTVLLTVTDGGLVVEVTDDGAGIRPETPAGVGLVSIRERVAELGGDCRIECPGEHGTVVRAVLPMLEVVT
jgi:signal transduction histidine kinase